MHMHMLMHEISCSQGVRLGEIRNAQHSVQPHIASRKSRSSHVGADEAVASYLCEREGATT